MNSLELQDVDDLSSVCLYVESGHGVGDGFGEWFERLRSPISETRFEVLVQEGHANAVVCWKMEGEGGWWRGKLKIPW